MRECGTCVMQGDTTGGGTKCKRTTKMCIVERQQGMWSTGKSRSGPSVLMVTKIEIINNDTKSLNSVTSCAHPSTLDIPEDIMTPWAENETVYYTHYGYGERPSVR